MARRWGAATHHGKEATPVPAIRGHAHVPRNSRGERAALEELDLRIGNGRGGGRERAER